MGLTTSLGSQSCCAFTISVKIVHSLPNLNCILTSKVIIHVERNLIPLWSHIAITYCVGHRCKFRVHNIKGGSTIVVWAE